MNLNGKSFINFICALTFSPLLFAEQNLQVEPLSGKKNTHASWIFSGLVHNESGDEYGYFFQVKRENNVYQAMAVIVDSQNKDILFFKERLALKVNSKAKTWKVGRAFLNFNPITESWIFGLENKSRKGFNFKVDLLGHLGDQLTIKELSSGFIFSINQTGRLNGHLQRGDAEKEEFVTDKKNWFEHLWLSTERNKSHAFTTLLCRFNDGSGLHSLTVQEEEAKHGAVVGLYNGKGQPELVSQFIDVKKDSDGLWHIRISSPKMHFVLTDKIEQHPVVSGFVNSKDKSGFCVINQDALGDTANESKFLIEASLNPLSFQGEKKQESWQQKVMPEWLKALFGNS